ncbi:MAG: Uma2 family endonuclease [Armatimonadetes bacterium]|nr:Uma2 family endonuclease [Armatimonadota bacterium]
MEESIRPDVSHLITEDDEPVDNWFQERQQRLLPDSLYASWAEAGQLRPFLAGADVGLFYKVSQQAVIPDVMVSLDVTVPDDWWEDYHRSYMIWEFGKAPDIVIEVVSNRKGGEEDKLNRYALAGVPYSVIYDPRLYLSKRPLRVYALHAGRYVDVLEPSWLEGLDVGLVLWEGIYEGMTATWLRWCDRQRTVLPTGLERAQGERERAERECERAERECERAERECERAERLAARLRELGCDPD